MVEIKNTQVYNLREAVVASGNAMRLETEEVNEENFNNALERCKRLAKLGGGTGHSNFRTGIMVSFDLKYEQYFSKQIQRYHFFQYVSSTSLMHRIVKMDFSKCCNKYVSPASIVQINYFIYLYNCLSNNKEDKDTFFEVKNNYIEAIETFGDVKDYNVEIVSNTVLRITGINEVEDLLYDLYMSIISNCPMGAELWVHCSTNYEQLATIYKQRKNHKLKEDWGEFCSWIKSLPYAKELIICE